MDSVRGASLGIRGSGVIKVDMDLVRTINDFNTMLGRIQSDIDYIKSDLESICAQLKNQQEEIIKINTNRSSFLKCLGWAYDHILSLLIFFGTIGTFIYQFIKKTI